MASKRRCAFKDMFNGRSKTPPVDRYAIRYRAVGQHAFRKCFYQLLSEGRPCHPNQRRRGSGIWLLRRAYANCSQAGAATEFIPDNMSESWSKRFWRSRGIEGTYVANGTDEVADSAGSDLCQLHVGPLKRPLQAHGAVHYQFRTICNVALPIRARHFFGSYIVNLQSQQRTAPVRTIRCPRKPPHARYVKVAFRSLPLRQCPPTRSDPFRNPSSDSPVLRHRGGLELSTDAISSRLRCHAGATGGSTLALASYGGGPERVIL